LRFPSNSQFITPRPKQVYKLLTKIIANNILKDKKLKKLYENQFGTFELGNGEFKNVETGETFPFDFNCNKDEIRYYPDGGEMGNGFSIAKLVKE